MVIGMAHRGRLNVLANIIGKPLGQIFSEFEGNIDPSSDAGLGRREVSPGRQRRSSSRPPAKEIVVSLAANPSHLEAVNPVVEGMVRAKQERLGDTRARPRDSAADSRRRRVRRPGRGGRDAESFAARWLSHRRHHPLRHQQSDRLHHAARRFALHAYATDIARMVQAPIFHVNGDDPEAAIRVCALAFDYRQQFKRDVVIDMVCYRRHGHNETDDPAYTQPIMYRKIKEHPSVAHQYSDRLVREQSCLTAEEPRSFERRFPKAERRVRRQQSCGQLGPAAAIPTHGDRPNSTTAIESRERC
jgi:multifunctional 2-oxoglutarate metabolism enzyme